jgi:hypothetical protein
MRRNGEVKDLAGIPPGFRLDPKHGEKKKEEPLLTPLPTSVIQLGLEPRTLPQSGMLYLPGVPSVISSIINCLDFLFFMNLSRFIADFLS